MTVKTFDFSPVDSITLDSVLAQVRNTSKLGASDGTDEAGTFVVGFQQEVYETIGAPINGAWTKVRESVENSDNVADALNALEALIDEQEDAVMKALYRLAFEAGYRQGAGAAMWAMRSGKV